MSFTNYTQFQDNDFHQEVLFYDPVLIRRFNIFGELVLLTGNITSSSISRIFGIWKQFLIG